VSIVEEMQVYYGRRAAVYDQSMGYTDPSVFARLEPVVTALRNGVAGRNVLELACGPGFWTQLVADTASRVTAFDYNASTIAEARRKPIDWGRVTLIVGDAYALPFTSRAFDAAVATDWLAHVPRSRLSPFLEQLHAVLEPAARVMFTDQLPGPESLTGAYDEEGNHLQERTLPDGSRYRVIKHFWSDDEIRTLFAPHAESIEISRFPGCRRIVLTYRARRRSN